MLSCFLPAIPIRRKIKTLGGARIRLLSSVRLALKRTNWYLINAPLNALGISKNEKCTYKDAMKDRRRMRKQVGLTNRWRLPEPLGSDILGTSQALRAVITPLNMTMKRIISAESPHLSVNVDSNKPYSFRQMTEQRISAPNSAETSRSRKLSKNSPTAQNLFYYYTKKAKTKSADHKWTNYDVILKCLNVTWELHSQFIIKSPVLAKLLEISSNLQSQNRQLSNSSSSSLKKSASKIRTQQNGQQHDSPSKEERVISAKADQYMAGDIRQRISASSDESMSNIWNRSSVSLTVSTSVESCCEKLTVIQLDVTDPMVTKKGLAIALGNLYFEELNIVPLDIPHTLAAAHILESEDLKERCAEAMCNTISTETIAFFHKISLQYNLEEISIFCERWLELNLIPVLSKEIQLGDVSKSLIEKTVSSRNLFTEDEFAVYRTLCYWLFLHLNPCCYSLPSISAIVAYFNCLCKKVSFLETDEGAPFIHLFWSIRFQGITDTNHIHMMKVMNLIPQSWLVDVLCQHYSALQCGGDMSSISNFELGSIRQGIVVEKGKSYDSEVMSLYGFHFNLRVNCSENLYTFYIQRLKPADPTLSFRECERHTFSLRAERTVNYCITVQTYSHGKQVAHTTGIREGTFRHGKKTSKSKELLFKADTFPLYATFAILLPRS